jgi:hypothetical protein
MPHSASGYGEIRVGRFYVVEMEKVTESTDGKLGITGQESSPPTTPEMVTFLHGQVAGLQEGRLVPVIFEDKEKRNGYYAVAQASSELTDYQGEVLLADWSIDLERHGSDAEVDIQTRLTGAIRQNDFTLTGTRWHAPAIGHYGYYTGSTNPSGSVTRASADGNIKVWLGIPSDIHPKWGCAVEDFYGGRVRITDTLEVTSENEVEGINRQISASGWTLDNGLLRIAPSGSGNKLNVQYYTGSAWVDNVWKLQVDGSDINAFSSATILRNDFEQCVIRLVASVSTGGRQTIDLSLRRGARFVEGYMQNSTSATLKVAPDNTTSSSSGTGYQIASSGTHRPAVGSARTFTVDNTNGGISKSSTLALDFWLGVVINAASPATGDSVTNLRDQFIATLPEITYAVRR